MTTTPALTAPEVRRLTLYKWSYQLRSKGFTKQEAARLLFEKWRRRAAMRAAREAMSE